MKTLKIKLNVNFRFLLSMELSMQFTYNVLELPVVRFETVVDRNAFNKDNCLLDFCKTKHPIFRRGQNNCLFRRDPFCKCIDICQTVALPCVIGRFYFTNIVKSNPVTSTYISSKPEESVTPIPPCGFSSVSSSNRILKLKFSLLEIPCFS